MEHITTEALRRMEAKKIQARTMGVERYHAALNATGKYAAITGPDDHGMEMGGI